MAKTKGIHRQVSKWAGFPLSEENLTHSRGTALATASPCQAGFCATIPLLPLSLEGDVGRFSYCCLKPRSGRLDDFIVTVHPPLSFH